MRVSPSFVATAFVAALAAHTASAQHAHGPQPTTTPTVGADRGDSTVVAAMRALFAAAERSDLAALDSLYAGDSLTVVEGAGINRGWVDYRDHHLAPEMKEMKNFRYRPFEFEGRASGELGWATFRYALTADVHGKPVDVVGRGTAILEGRGGRWIIRHTQTASRSRRPNNPPMPQ